MDETPYDCYGRKQTSIVAIDATKFNKTSEQFSTSHILRELNKVKCTVYLIVYAYDSILNI